MTTYIVTTATDTLDGDDGLLSLREAVALANANPNADVITFDLPTLTVYIDDSAIEIAAGTNLTIDGDVNDDGITDIILWAGQNHHLTVDVDAQVSLTGLDFTGGGFHSPNVPNAPAGDPGANGERGFGKEDIVSDPDLHLFEFYGASGEDGTSGEAGERGTDGQDRDVKAGAILNFGTLDLVRVGFAGNDAIGGVGGNAGNGGTGGAGGQGGEGVQGDRISAQHTGGAINGGHGGNGVDGSNGGDGGDGGSAAGAIYNATGASLSMTDVTFGGILTSLWDRGEGSSDNTATGGRGGLPGNGGNGGQGGWGGDGATTGHQTNVVIVDDEAIYSVTYGGAGNGGNGGDGGKGGNAGAYGNSGDAAGAILNDGVIAGTAALYDNTASTTDMNAFYQSKPVSGLGGLANNNGGTGGNGSGNVDQFGGFAPDGADGDSGIAGAEGFDRVAGETGDTSDGILNRGGTGNVATGSALVYAHGIDLDVDEGGAVSFNIIRIGARGGDVTVTWELQPRGANGADASDFEGGALPSGEVVLASPVNFGDAAKSVSFQVANDALAEGLENYRIVLTDVSISSGDVKAGTSTLDGQISDSEAVDPNKPTNGNDHLIGTNKKDVIDAKGGNDTVKGRDGNDSLSGGKGKDRIDGGEGKDTLKGGDKNDVLAGGKHNDTLFGNKGNDTFVFHTKLHKKNNVDSIEDFKVNKDVILLDKDIFSKVGKDLGKKQFEIGKKADDGKDRIIYDKKSGNLFYDKDGKGGAGQVKFAALDKNLKLDHKDFNVGDFTL